MKTKITELLGIEYPIIQGGMAWVANASLSAHVSAAGGIGFIGAANMPADMLRQEIRKAKAITDKPVGVNIMLLSPYAGRALLPRQKCGALRKSAIMFCIRPISGLFSR